MQSTRPATQRLPWLVVGLSLLAFLSAAIALIPLAGPQQDELLFAMPLTDGSAAHHSISIFGRKIPLMLMSYLGCLKTWLYAPLYGNFPFDVWWLRLPPVLLGVLTLMLFFLLLRRTATAGVAAAGALLLGTDPTFLLTNTFDWGPVAIQHLCLVAALWSLVRWHQSGQQRGGLGWGFFFLGLGLWDKSLMLWLIGGLGVSGLVLFRREVAAAFRIRHLRVAILGFALGALPWLLFNVRRPAATFQGNATRSLEGLSGKAMQVKYNLQGAGLYGYLVNEDWVEPARPVTVWLGRAAEMSRRTGLEPRNTWLFGAVIGSLLLAPLWWTTRFRRQILFCLVTGASAWLAQATTDGAGGAAHHVVLLWPLPHWLAAAAWGSLAEKWPRRGVAILGAMAGAVAISQFLVSAEYCRKLERNGAGVVWTQAGWSLAENARRYGDRTLYMADWGMQNVLEVATRGRIQTFPVFDLFADDDLTQPEREIGGRALSTPAAVFVGYAGGYEVFPGAQKRLEQFASASGFEKRTLETIYDWNGRPVYEFYEFQPARR